MKVYDLVCGQEVELPSTGVASGRYRLIQASLLNGEVKLSRGAILWRLGEGSVSLTAEEQPNVRVPIRFVPAPRQSTMRDVVDLSIAAVVESWSIEMDASQLPSPLLPSVLRDRMELMDPEPELERALATGQWDEISIRPRMDMHYVPETLPVARAKRVQASVVEHLSQHSELWARRNISGVVPAKVLARVSEDDHAIYENIVFARLLDGCAHWLNGRIAEVRAIADGQSMAMKLEKSDERHRLLRDRICSLWGKAWFSETEDSQITRKTLDRLGQMRFHVERLRRSGVYKRVPRSARVPLRLRPTNIFQYDKRYRELRPFWDSLATANSKDSVSESERYQSIMSKQADFHSYLLLLLCHALRDMGAARTGGSGLHYRVGPWEIQVDSEGVGEVRIKVLACGKILRSRTMVLLLAKEEETECSVPDRSVFYAKDLMSVGASEDRDEEPGVLNPFRFFAVERIRQILERDLCEIFLGQYPPVVVRVPGNVRDKLGEARDIFRPEGGMLFVLPNPKTPAPVLYGWVSDACALHPEVETQLRYAIGLGQWLVRCRACGVDASERDMLADERALRLVCPSCRLETIVKTSPVRTMTSHFVGSPSGFEFCGGVEVHLAGLNETEVASETGMHSPFIKRQIYTALPSSVVRTASG